MTLTMGITLLLAFFLHVLQFSLYQSTSTLVPVRSSVALQPSPNTRASACKRAMCIFWQSLWLYVNYSKDPTPLKSNMHAYNKFSNINIILSNCPSLCLSTSTWKLTLDLAILSTFMFYFRLLKIQTTCHNLYYISLHALPLVCYLKSWYTFVLPRCIAHALW